MNKPIRILHLEDNPYDAELLRSKLQVAGMNNDVTLVQTRSEFLTAIEHDGFDLIISDFTLPSFDGLSALQIAREKCPVVPFVFLSGTIGEDAAIESLVSGATDYVIKNNLNRLVPAVQRALRDAENWRMRKEAEREAQKLLSAVEQTANCILVTDKNGIIEYVNPNFVRTTGYTKEESIGKTPRILKSGKHDEMFYRKLWETILSGKIFYAEFINRTKNGDLIYQEETITPIRDQEGNITHFVATGRDISDRKRAEKKLLESEERYRKFFEDDLTGDYISTAEGRLVDCNPAFARIFGFASVEEIVKADLAALYPNTEERKTFLDLIRRKKKLEYHEMNLRRKDGTSIYVVANVVGIFDEQGQLVQIKGYLFDDTRRKNLEQQLIQSQKLESIGTLAGGIAHDVNNILGIILGHANLLEGGLDDPEKRALSLGAITKGVERGAGVVRQLLTFARKSEVYVESVRVNEVVNEITKLLRATFPKTITLSLKLAKEVPTITADSNQLHQALLNLAVNARDAMPKGGTLTISTRTAKTSELSERFHGAQGDEYVCLSVADTGSGMDASTRSHIFEPFYTTKEVGKGTGLGLAVVYGIVSAHKGLIDVESQVGRGTTFHLYFPVLPPSADQLAARHEMLKTTSGGTETLLLVEDEDMLRDLAKAILEVKGYDILTAVDGEDALAVYAQHQAEIALVISDVGLPKFGGEELFTRLKQINPTVKIIFASGYFDPNLKSEMFKAGAKDFIQKPYQPNEMLQKIRRVLDGDEKSET